MCIDYRLSCHKILEMVCSRRYISSWGTCWQRTVICRARSITIGRRWHRIRSMPTRIRRSASLPATRNSTVKLRFLLQPPKLPRPFHTRSTQLAQRVLPAARPSSSAPRLVLCQFRWRCEFNITECSFRVARCFSS